MQGKYNTEKYFEKFMFWDALYSLLNQEQIYVLYHLHMTDTEYNQN